MLEIKNWKLGFSCQGGSGQSLVELLVAIGLSALFIPVLLTGMVAARSGRAQDDQRTQAIALVKEAQDAVRVIRDASWTTFSSYTTGQPYHPVISGSTWALTSGSEFINGFGFTRQIVLSDVYRDGSGNIAASGTLDLSTKKVVVTVSWNSPLVSSVSEISYLTRFVNNTYTETTQSDFLKGATASGKLAITNNTGGEVTLGTGSGAGDDWCNPGNSSLATSALVRNGTPYAISATTSASTDHIYVTTGNNASGYVGEVLSVDHNTPPNVTVGNSYNTGKGYGVYVDHDGGYVYVAETTKTVEILDATSMAQVSYFDVSGSAIGNSVFVLNGIGYVTVSAGGGTEKLYTFNANPINVGGSQAQLGSVSLAAKGNKVVVVKDPTSGTTYAYVVEASSSKQLEIFQVSSNGSTLSNVANAQIANAAQGQDVFVNTSGTRAYLVTNQYTAGQNQFFILNTTTKSGTLPSPIGAFSTFSQATMSAGMNPKGVTVVTGNKAIVVGSQIGGLGQQYQVYNIASENNIKYCGGASTATIPNGTDVNAISSLYRSDQTAYSYILRSDQTVQIIQGGNGAAFSFFGTFESQTFTATTDAMFNTFTTTTSVPVSTTLQFQVAIKHAVNNSCNSVSFANTDFVGTDGTSGTYFPATGGILPMSNDNIGYENPGRCLRYRAYLSSTDITQSPELYDITFNYSP